MAQTLLTIYIPIYNRSVFLERMLNVFYEDKELFDDKINLVISDNCSIENNKEICNKYKENGLNVHFSCNNTNIGPDANILKGLKIKDSQYIWVLGSDDIPVPGFVKKIVNHLEEKERGVVHIDYKTCEFTTKEYNDKNKFVEDVYMHFTFTSGNIVSTKYANKIDFEKYTGQCLYQVPLYLEACSSMPCNSIVEYQWLQPGNDYINNGGYGLFEVFVQNFLNIVKQYINKGRFSKSVYPVIKKRTFIYHVKSYIYENLLKKGSGNYDVTFAWRILFKYYGNTWYFYFYVLRMYFVFIMRRMFSRG